MHWLHYGTTAFHAFRLSFSGTAFTVSFRLHHSALFHAFAFCVSSSFLSPSQRLYSSRFTRWLTQPFLLSYPATLFSGSHFFGCLGCFRRNPFRGATIWSTLVFHPCYAHISSGANIFPILFEPTFEGKTFFSFSDTGINRFWWFYTYTFDR